MRESSDQLTGYVMCEGQSFRGLSNLSGRSKCFKKCNDRNWLKIQVTTFCYYYITIDEHFQRIDERNIKETPGFCSFPNTAAEVSAMGGSWTNSLIWRSKMLRPETSPGF